MSNKKEGGERPLQGDGPNLRADDFVARIVEDPNEPPDLLLLSGYLGASSEEGHVRLYLDEELSRYVEIPNKAVRYSQELPPEQSPLGGSLVWIDRDAEVLHGKAGRERRSATFLEGQIAQDYMSGAGGFGGEGGEGGDAVGGGGEAGGGVAQTRLLGCRSEAGPCIPKTTLGPDCQSQFGPCITRTELPGCQTLTGIFCTRLGPGCRRSVFDPGCTAVGPNCHTAHIRQCWSVFYPCVTHDIECQASGYVPCNPPVDFTIWQGQFGGAGGLAAARMGGRFGGGFGGQIGGTRPPSLFGDCTSKLVFPCPSIHICPSLFGNVCQSQLNLCFTISPRECPPPVETSFNCVLSVNVRCPPTVVDCPSVNVPCQTQSGPGCMVSQVAVCDTRVCGFQSAACGVNPGGGGFGGGGGGEAFANAAFAAQPMAAQPMGAAGGAAALPRTRVCASMIVHCPTMTLVLQTPDPRQCMPTWLPICNPTPFCPTQAPGCGGFTQLGRCETLGQCPSAVDACPTRFGCYETQVCGVSQACFPEGGGGGFNPGGGFGGGGFGGGVF